jgi:hypothetical protein
LAHGARKCLICRKLRYFCFANAPSILDVGVTSFDVLHESSHCERAKEERGVVVSIARRLGNGALSFILFAGRCVLCNIQWDLCYNIAFLDVAVREFQGIHFALDVV